MKPTEDLFELIHSLSKDERRGFQIHASRYESKASPKKYLLLFNAISTQDEYNEEEIRQSLLEVIPGKNFASWKRHLIELVEGFLREYHVKKSVHGQVNALLQEAELLRQRGLLMRCRKKLDQTKKLASKYELISVKMGINGIERMLVKEFKRKEMGKEVAELLAEWKRLHQDLQVEQDYIGLYDQLSVILRTRFNARDLKDKTEMQTLCESNLLSDDALQPSFLARRMYHNARTCCFRLAGKHKAEFNEYRQLLHLWQTNPHQIQLKTKLYKFTLTNLLHSAALVGDHAMFPEILEELKCHPATNNHDAVEDFQAINFFQLLYLMNQGMLEEGLAEVNTIEKGLKRFGRRVNDARRLSFCCNIAILYFFCADNRNSLKWLAKMIEGPRTEHRMDLQILARLLEPVVYYEMDIKSGNLELVASKSKAASEWMRQRKRLLKLEKLVLKTLNKLVEDQANERLILSGFLTEIERLRQEDGAVNGSDELYIWAKSRLLGIPMRKLISAGQIDNTDLAQLKN